MFTRKKADNCLSMREKINNNTRTLFCLLAMALMLVWLQPSQQLQARSYVATLYDWNPRIIEYIQYLRVMTENFPCDPHPQCLQGTSEPAGARYQAFQEIEQKYQDGYLNYLEGEYREAYNSYGQVIILMDRLFIDLASFYVDRSRELLARAMEKTDPANPYDLSYAEIKSYYTPNSAKAKDIRRPREVPTEGRRYNNQEIVYYTKRRELALNIRQGFARVRFARVALDKAVMNEISTMRRLFRQSPDFEELERLTLAVAANGSGAADGADADAAQANQAQAGTEDEQTAATSEISQFEFTQDRALSERRERVKAERKRYQEIIERFSAKYPRNSLILESKLQKVHWLLKSIVLSRMVKINIWQHYRLKHPHGNYVAFNPYGKTRKGETPAIEDVSMNWYENPYLYPKDQNPMFDFVIPADLRRDLLDMRNEVYQDRVDVEVRLKYQPTTGTGTGNPANRPNKIRVGHLGSLGAAQTNRAYYHTISISGPHSRSA